MIEHAFSRKNVNPACSRRQRVTPGTGACSDLFLMAFDQVRHQPTKSPITSSWALILVRGCAWVRNENLAEPRADIHDSLVATADALPMRDIDSLLSHIDIFEVEVDDLAAPKTSVEEAAQHSYRARTLERGLPGYVRRSEQDAIAVRGVEGFRRATRRDGRRLHPMKRIRNALTLLEVIEERTQRPPVRVNRDALEPRSPAQLIHKTRGPSASLPLYRPCRHGRSETTTELAYTSSAERLRWLGSYMHFYNFPQSPLCARFTIPVSRLVMNNVLVRNR